MPRSREGRVLRWTDRVVLNTVVVRVLHLEVEMKTAQRSRRDPLVDRVHVYHFNPVVLQRKHTRSTHSRPQLVRLSWLSSYQ